MGDLIGMDDSKVDETEKDDLMDLDDGPKRILARFTSDQGVETDGLYDIPIDVSKEQLTNIVCALLKREDPTNLSFYVNDQEVANKLVDVLTSQNANTEQVVDIIYNFEAVFKVRAVSRCSGDLPGHEEAVISVKFSGNSLRLASGSGDKTVRLWDLTTNTPLFKCEGHKNWVLCIAWSGDSARLVSGCRDGVILHWDAATGKQLGKPMAGHKQFITALVWQPYHLDPSCRLFASSSKDGDVRIWDSTLCQCLRALTSHRLSITSLLWGGTDLIYSGSQDRTIKVWRASDGVMCRTLEGHAHWVNTLALSTDYVMRTAVSLANTDDKSEKVKFVKEKYGDVRGSGEILVSGSDDFTLYLWDPENNKKPITRMTGHQQLINCVQFSPNSKLLASASFDKSIKLWDGKTGKFLTTLRGHVQAVYMVSWSADSRLLVSGSADSTLKVWSMKTKKLLNDLPGHQDEVYAVDWSSDGERVASGGKDKVLKIWAY